ncbi:MAG: bifunctional UDP-N-acetylglucosamine diphosphorylase/glucosamine-1-phosphate N-acetyltransferase GlmU [Bacillota bacterium]|jgi:bifunctional UDP-N-acetylglucosamine pyrophosphorylase/glucosamine-1-phosphate N-acetyltransferase
MQTSAIILAAGSGTRMKSQLNKVLHPLCGRPLVSHVIQAGQDAAIENFYVVIGRDAEQVKATLGGDYTYVLQRERLGTGHAVMQVEPVFRGEDLVFVLCGDTPLIRPETLQAMQAMHLAEQADVTVLTATLPQGADYGRIVRADDGRILGIVEAKEATPAQLAIREINTGFYCFKGSTLFAALHQVDNHNAQAEYYLTDVIALVAQAGGKVVGCPLDDFQEALGINDRVRLAEAEAYLRQRIRERLMLAGVTFLQPETTLVDDTVSIGQDTIVYPGCLLEGNTAIGSGCVIGPYTRLTDCRVGDRTSIEFSVARQAATGADCVIGPYAYLRPDTSLADRVKVGDFVELKNAQVGSGSKLPHLSYVGDVTIGQRTNLGAGTILVNYDGKDKHHSQIDDDAFIGCNSNLISPVHIGAGAYVAAGSTITDDVPADALAIARSRQVNKAEWAKRRRERQSE